MKKEIICAIYLLMQNKKSWFKDSYAASPQTSLLQTETSDSLTLLPITLVFEDSN